MAQKVQTLFVSDLSGDELGENGQTVKFGYLGADYEIDLSQQEADEFAAAMDKYVNAGRRVGGRRQAGSGGTSGRSRGSLRKMRAWARENGYEVSDRGRLPKEVEDAYYAAH